LVYVSPPSVERNTTPMFCLLDTGQSTNEREPFDVVGSKFRPGSPPKRIGSTTVPGVNVTNESLRVPADVAPAGAKAVAAVSAASASAEMAAGMRDMGASGCSSLVVRGLGTVRRW
jgi:hypothetical protein